MFIYVIHIIYIYIYSHKQRQCTYFDQVHEWMKKVFKTLAIVTSLNIILHVLHMKSKLNKYLDNDDKKISQDLPTKLYYLKQSFFTNLSIQKYHSR